MFCSALISARTKSIATDVLMRMCWAFCVSSSNSCLSLSDSMVLPAVRCATLVLNSCMRLRIGSKFKFWASWRVLGETVLESRLMPVRRICFGTSTVLIVDVEGAADAAVAGCQMLWSVVSVASKQIVVSRRRDYTSEPPDNYSVSSLSNYQSLNSIKI